MGNVKCEIVVQRLGFYVDRLVTDLSSELDQVSIYKLLEEALEGDNWEWYDMMNQFRGAIVGTELWGSWEGFIEWNEEWGKCFGFFCKLQDGDWKHWNELEDLIFVIGEILVSMCGFIELVEELDPLEEYRLDYLREFKQG
jgi:hypothetical protein